ncbi:MAG: penicillin-binding protein 1A [Alphaproteobacteria bacterium]
MLKFLGFVFGAVFLLGVAGAGGGLFVLYHYGRDLPDFDQLATYQPPVMTRVHTADGSLLTEYAIEKRVFVPVAAMPRQLIEAFLAAEDDTFFEHPGVDARSVIGAAITNLMNYGGDRRPVGASTITQQVAKNFLLTNEVSIDRKVKEAILAFRIERALSKERILELYLNEIYLGQGSYGVAAAALNYFDRSLDNLNLQEMAYLAALPKAPNNYHPTRRAAAAKDRRDWVLGRMAAVGFIAESEATLASQTPLVVTQGRGDEFVDAAYFTEEVRRQLYDSYGEKGLYEGGLSVRTTLEPRLQAIARSSLRRGLEAYDRRHGWRGPVARISTEGWERALETVDIPKGIRQWQLAAVLAVEDVGAQIGLRGGGRGFVPFDELKWARPHRDDQSVGAAVKRTTDVLAVGDVVLVDRLETDSGPVYGLRQVPDLQGALVAMDPHTGRVLAMVGGYDYSQSQFNRATQAMRQPGSAFKPFVYAAALENGFTPVSRVLDAPFVIDQGAGLGRWKPANYTNRFYGPSTLRLGIEKSRNLMTVRLAQFIGMDVVSDYAERFGIVDDLPQFLSMSLGAGETTLMRLTTAYAMLVNGGKRISPTLIDRVQDRRGRTILKHDGRACDACVVQRWDNQAEPVLSDDRPSVIRPETAYQMVSMLEGVVERGTGVAIRRLGMHLAGKTGTTNDNIDAWFLGFSPDLVVGVFTGFDEPQSLGATEQGASVAVPIFRDFMEQALAGQTDIPFRIPSGVRLVRIDAASGALANERSEEVILEAFRPGSEPTAAESAVLDTQFGTVVPNRASTGSGVGGLY